MKRLFAATFLLASLTGPVLAQPSRDDDPIIMRDRQRTKDAEEIDKQYKSTLDKTRKPAVETRTDPWSNMRGADVPKPNDGAVRR